MRTLFYPRLLATIVLLAGISACGTTGSSRVSGLHLSEEPLVGKFVWHDLMTDDVAAARTFYGGLFGWSFEDTQHPNGGDYVLITAGDRFVGGMVQLADPPNEDFSRWLGYLSVADVDNAVSLAESFGGTTVVGPLDLPNIGRAAAIQDPQGAVVGLLRSNMGDPDDSVSPSLGQIVWNELLAADDLRAAQFYVQIADVMAKFNERRGGQYITLRSQQRYRAGIMLRPADDIDPFWLTHFAVTDPSAAAARVLELGGEVILAPSEELREGSLAVVTDPTGAILALHKWPEQDRSQP